MTSSKTLIMFPLSITDLTSRSPCSSLITLPQNHRAYRTTTPVQDEEPGLCLGDEMHRHTNNSVIKIDTWTQCLRWHKQRSTILRPELRLCPSAPLPQVPMLPRQHKSLCFPEASIRFRRAIYNNNLERYSNADSCESHLCIVNHNYRLRMDAIVSWVLLHDF